MPKGLGFNPQTLAKSPLAPLVSLTNDATKPASQLPKSIPIVRLTNDATSGKPRKKTEPSVTPISPDVWLEPGYGFGWNTPARLAALEAAYGGGDKTPKTPGGGGAGVTVPAVSPTLPPLHEIQWQVANIDIPGGHAPSWWVPLVPKNLSDVERPDVQQLLFLNTLIPYLSPEDQRNAAAQLYTAAADAFSYYKPEKTGSDIPFSADTIRLSELSGLTPIDAEYFTSAQRAEDAMKALSNIRELTVQGNRWKLGPGYTFLQNIIGTAGKYGATGPDTRQTRTQQQAFLGALDPLFAQGQQADIGPAAAVAQMFATPFFSQGQLFPQRRTEAGQTFLGGINPLLFA